MCPVFVRVDICSIDRRLECWLVWNFYHREIVETPVGVSIMFHHTPQDFGGITDTSSIHFYGGMHISLFLPLTTGICRSNMTTNYCTLSPGAPGGFMGSLILARKNFITPFCHLPPTPSLPRKSMLALWKWWQVWVPPLRLATSARLKYSSKCYLIGVA